MIELRNTTGKFGADYIKGCAEANKLTDTGEYGNNDGKLQPKEMYQESVELSKTIFGENEQILEKALNINAKGLELSNIYAGADGVISAEEKAEMINSKEWRSSMEVYRSLYKEADCSKNYGAKYYNDGVKALKDLDKTEGNGDGKVTAKEFGAKIMNLYNALFRADTVKLEKSKEIAKSQEEIVAKYAGDDGILSPAEHIGAINSEEYGKTLKNYNTLMPQNQRMA